MFKSSLEIRKGLHKLASLSLLKNDSINNDEAVTKKNKHVTAREIFPIPVKNSYNAQNLCSSFSEIEICVLLEKRMRSLS